MRDSIRSSLLGREEKESSVLEEAEGLCSLTLKQRLMGFVICLLIGLFFCLFSIFFLPSIVLNPIKFALPYTLGNVFALGSTLFLIGPMRQLKSMFKPIRIVATLIYLGAMAFTLWAAIGLKSGIITFVAIIIQFFAITWYVLSYIPYARTCVKNLAAGAVSV